MVVAAIEGFIIALTPIAILIAYHMGWHSGYVYRLETDFR